MKSNLPSIYELLSQNTEDRVYNLYLEALGSNKRLEPIYEEFIKLDAVSY